MFDKMLQYPPRPLAMERLWKSNAQVAPNCPRCASTNTKFCYYNNYSFSQPRYFCKACRRYWTKGGSLRNVPVGGGCRRSRRPKSARSSYPINPPSPGRSGSDPVNESDGSSVIDLAAVFAKYLNQNSSSEETESFDLQASSEFNEGRVHEGVSRVEDHVDGFTGHDPNAFEFQAIVPDVLPGEVAWTDGEIMPDFGWQLQEFGSFLGDDQLEISSNVMSDNWSSLDMDMDILGYDIFSRPSNLI